MSECSTFLSSSSHRPSADHALGWPQQGRRICLRAVHDPTQEAMLGEEGIIAVHQDDPGLMLGYLNAANETADRFVDGWFLTGDHARIGENGAYYYTGRKDDMMNAGGFRVSPIELEHSLSQVQGITSLACVEVEIKADAKIIVVFLRRQVPILKLNLKNMRRSIWPIINAPRPMCALTPCPKTRTVRLTEMLSER